GSNNSANFSINKASSTTTVTCADSTYDATPQADCTASFSGVGLTGGSLTVSYSGRGTTTYAGPGAPTNVGDYTGSASYGGDANHNGSNNSAYFTVTKANPVCSISGYSVTYDGSAHTASGTCKGVGTEATTDLAGLNKSGTTHTNAGDWLADPWSFTDSSGNYNNT